MGSLVFNHGSGSESTEIQLTALYGATSAFTSCKVSLFHTCILKSSPNSSSIADFLTGGDDSDASGCSVSGDEAAAVVPLAL